MYRYEILLRVVFGGGVGVGKADRDRQGPPTYEKSLGGGLGWAVYQPSRIRDRAGLGDVERRHSVASRIGYVLTHGVGP